MHLKSQQKCGVCAEPGLPRSACGLAGVGCAGRREAPASRPRSLGARAGPAAPAGGGWVPAFAVSQWARPRVHPGCCLFSALGVLPGRRSEGRPARRLLLQLRGTRPGLPSAGLGFSRSLCDARAPGTPRSIATGTFRLHPNNSLIQSHQKTKRCRRREVG